MERARLTSRDVVYDLGAGTGAITYELLRTGAHVAAVEIDQNLAAKLRDRFRNNNLTVISDNITNVEFTRPFKVVANIPFNLTAWIVRRLLIAGPHPEDAHIVLQREAAKKYAGLPRDCETSLRIRPWFEITIVQGFHPTDFVPIPGVDVVHLRAKLRRHPLVSEAYKPTWNAFVGYAFRGNKPTARRALRKVFSHLQWKILATRLAFNRDATLTELSLEQWLGLFAFFLAKVPPQRRHVVFP